MDTQRDIPGFLQSNKPVLFPSHAALTLSRDEFNSLVAGELRGLVTQNTQIPAEAKQSTDSNPFIDGLHKHEERQLASTIGSDSYNKMLTRNADVAYKSSDNKLVDLFYELEESISGARLAQVLADAWKVDPLTSLKIIFNARSIHLGKSSRKTFYLAAGWLAKNHPQTLVANLQWLYRPVIEKKAKKPEDGEDGEDGDIVLVESEISDDDPTKHDVRHGVAHGYWKDLLNILAIAANRKLDGRTNPSKVLNTENETVKINAIQKRARKRGDKVTKLASGVRRLHITKPASTEYEAEYKRKMLRHTRNATAIDMFEKDPVYRTLHLTVARLFAEQLERDVSTLRGGDSKAKKEISICAKWAPSDDRFHDKHTFIVSSIAELMYPRSSLDGKAISGDHMLQPTDGRELYLRYAREMYRRDVSQLRKHLHVVERDITAKTYTQIDYRKVPSQAMHQYRDLFAKRDTPHFMAYLKDVAMGKASISGATLLPSTLIKDLRTILGLRYSSNYVVSAPATIKSEVINLQWKTLVQRLKDSGTMSSAIAVCDVSGSMSSVISKDGTQAMDASIGLSLLVAEVTDAPFGGSVITFESNPHVRKVDLNMSLAEKYLHLKEAPWGGSTDFVAVFTNLILPMAVQNNLKQEDMVKRVFVFSDMQFNSADRMGNDRWTTSYQRIKAQFEAAGYEMPELVFWNLCGQRGNADFGSSYGRTEASAKPVTASEVGTMLVSGYSQGMLKAFMDGESMNEDDDEDNNEDDTEDGDAVVVGGAKKKQAEKKQADSMALVRKVTGHKAYDMLQVYD